MTAAASKRYEKVAFEIAAIATGGGQLLFFALIGLLLFGIPQAMPTAKAVLPAYVLTLTYLLGPLKNLVQQLPILATANVSIEKIDAMGLTLLEQAEINTVVQPPSQSSWSQLELKSVTHTYQSEEINHCFTIGPINLTLKPEELVFIVGGNGSGKSTLAKLITGLYIPEKGELCLDGRTISDTNREWYRQQFSVVFSDFYLFDRLMNVDTNDHSQKAYEYLNKLELHHKVSLQDGKLSTIALSRGQRQRLALLAAYLEDRPIYLFDEWAANQDPSFREIFYKQILPELKQRGKTVLVISHDEHFFHIADRVIKLDYGHIASEH